MSGSTATATPAREGSKARVSARLCIRRATVGAHAKATRSLGCCLKKVSFVLHPDKLTRNVHHKAKSIGSGHAGEDEEPHRL
jgi:hypothetical protein